MRVLHVIPSVGPLRGGPSVIVRTVACGLVRAGLDVHVATTDDNGPERLQVPLSKPLLEDGVTYWYFPRQTRFYTFSWPLSRWIAGHVRDYDLVHIHAVFSYAAIPAAYWSTRNKVPYVVKPLGVLSPWGMEKRRHWLKKLSFPLIEQRILKRAKVIDCESEQERTEVANLGITTRSVVLPESADIPAKSRDSYVGKFRAANPQIAKRRILIFLSRLDPKKGLDILLRSFVEIRTRFPDVALVIAGSGDAAYETQLNKEAMRLGVAADIFWLGFLTGEQKWEALADADIFVLPSYAESFGVAVVEAMGFGLPVVISDRVPIHREISETQAGIVVPCDPRATADAIITLLGDDEMRMKMGGNGRGLMLSTYSPDACRDRLIALYKSILDPPRSSSPFPQTLADVK